MPQIEVIGITGGHAIISYRNESPGTRQPDESERQTIDIVKPVSALLPELLIEDYIGGPVSPGRYPAGAASRKPPSINLNAPGVLGQVEVPSQVSTGFNGIDRTERKVSCC